MTTRAMTLTAARAGDAEGVLLALAQENLDAYESLCHLAIESGDIEKFFDALDSNHPDRPWLNDSLRSRTRFMVPYVVGGGAA